MKTKLHKCQNRFGTEYQNRFGFPDCHRKFLSALSGIQSFGSTAIPGLSTSHYVNSLNFLYERVNLNLMF